MNNIVEIIYGKSDRYPTISINGEKISRYMELADLIHDDIFNWAEKLYESMDDELCESYTVKLTGHPFHNMILKALQPRSQYCSEVMFTPIVHKIPFTDKLIYASELNQIYNLGISQIADGVSFFSDDPEQFRNVVPVSSEQGEYYITSTNLLPERRVRYCVMISEQIHFEKMHGTYILHMPIGMLGELVNYLNMYHLYIDFITEVFAATHDITLSDDERLKYEAYLNEEYRVRINALPQTLNTGDSFRVSYTYYPVQFGDPGIYARSDSPDVLTVCNDTLVANRAGSVNISFADRNGESYGSCMLSVEDHNFVSDISIILPGTSALTVNGVLRFKCLISPSDAEDINTVRYTIDNTAIAAFSGQNEIYGIAPGRVKVTVSTARVSRSVYLKVLPVAKEVLLPQEVLSIPNNALADIECTVFPANATPMPTVYWQSSNPSVVEVVGGHGFACQIATHNIGSAMLKCSLNGTDIFKMMRVDVEEEKGCYVATAVYGSYDCPQVWALRRYRDNFLSGSALGRAFIKVYYALSPTAIRWFGHTRWFNRLFRGILDRKVSKLKKHGYEDTPYND